jgi:hypothetical protein
MVPVKYIVHTVPYWPIALYVQYIQCRYEPYVQYRSYEYILDLMFDTKGLYHCSCEMHSPHSSLWAYCHVHTVQA